MNIPLDLSPLRQPMTDNLFPREDNSLVVC
ncbi:hypothetical protein BFJ67_g4519 [Fusarium oxysporum f. sp. cepae]|nr:hypothetical protein BFJ67_g4519 [Fusarium oxysporum f. sp. cepae]